MRCARCGTLETYIPTCQFVKVSHEQYYLCWACFQDLRSWMHAGERIGAESRKA